MAYHLKVLYTATVCKGNNKITNPGERSCRCARIIHHVSVSTISRLDIFNKKMGIHLPWVILRREGRHDHIWISNFSCDFSSRSGVMPLYRKWMCIWPYSPPFYAIWFMTLHRPERMMTQNEKFQKEKKIHNLLTYVSLVFIMYQFIYNSRVKSIKMLIFFENLLKPTLRTDVLVIIWWIKNTWP
jgi:hypothetical protein